MTIFINDVSNAVRNGLNIVQDAGRTAANYSLQNLSLCINGVQKIESLIGKRETE